jgi:hypothetical protein
MYSTTVLEGTISALAGTLAFYASFTFASGQLPSSGTLVAGTPTTYLTVPDGIVFNLSVEGLGHLVTTAGSAGIIHISNNVSWGIAYFDSAVIMNDSGNNTITISGDVTWAVSQFSITAGTITISIDDTCTLVQKSNITVNVGLTGAGTLSIASGVTATISSNISWGVSHLAGAGILAIGNATVTLAVNSEWTISQFSMSNAASTIAIGSYTLSFPGTTRWNETATGTISGSGEVHIDGNLLLNSNDKISNLYVGTLSGSGSITGGGCGELKLCNGTNMTLSIATIKLVSNWNWVSGKITFVGTQTVTIPTNTTVVLATGGIDSTYCVAGATTSISLASSTSILVVAGSGKYAQTDSVAASTFSSVTGTGILVESWGWNSNNGGTNNIAFSSTAIAAGANSTGTALSSASCRFKFCLSAIAGSAVGVYGIGRYTADPSNNSFVRIYIGTANNSYTMPTMTYGGLGLASYNTDYSGNTCRARNMTGSAGTITLTGNLYV